MDIGILTYYGVHNHGALLQANALKNVIAKQGHNCFFLKFERDYSNISSKQANKYKVGIGSISFYVKYLFEKGFGNIVYNIKKRNVLNKFRNENLPMGDNFDCFSGDLAIIGSDEVFSLEIGFNPFLYGYGLSAKNIISYAASFGPTVYEDIVKSNKYNIISDGLNKMSMISVRDKNSFDTVYKITEHEPYLVCDPVILYGYKKEMELYTPSEENYILIYSYDKNMNFFEEYDYIKKYAEKRNMKIFSVGYYHKWCKNINVSPIELLGWIKKSKLVITDTFHGAVLSIICNTQFVVKLRENRNKLEFLMSEYNLSAHIIEEFSELEKIADKHIDYSDINGIIQQKRNISMKFIENALKESNKLC